MNFRNTSGTLNFSWPKEPTFPSVFREQILLGTWISFHICGFKKVTSSFRGKLELQLTLGPCKRSEDSINQCVCKTSLRY